MKQIGSDIVDRKNIENKKHYINCIFSTRIFQASLSPDQEAKRFFHPPESPDYQHRTSSNIRCLHLAISHWPNQGHSLDTATEQMALSNAEGPENFHNDTIFIIWYASHSLFIIQTSKFRLAIYGKLEFQLLACTIKSLRSFSYVGVVFTVANCFSAVSLIPPIRSSCAWRTFKREAFSCIE